MVNLEGHENEVKSVCWSSNGKFLGTCGRDKTVWIWESLDDDHDFECAAVIMNHTQDVKKVIWHPKQSTLVSASYDDTIRFFNEKDNEWIETNCLTSHESTVWSIDFDSSGKCLVSSSDDKTLKVWSERNKDWKCVSTLSGYHERVVYDVSWSKVNHHIATAGGDNTICIFGENYDERMGDVNSVNFDLKCRQSAAHSNDINSIEWNPVDKNLLASGGDDAVVRIWSFDPLDVM